jgi:hypothetical protein
VRGEKIFGYVGLGLFFLFPLVSLLQLRDTDDTWRRVAERVRPAVLSLHVRSGDGASSVAAEPIASAVLLDGEPLRIAISGAPPRQPVASPSAAGWIEWRTVHVDAHGEFSILEAADARALLAARPGRASAAPQGTLRAEAVPCAPDEPEAVVTAALVAPAELAASPVWVGELMPGAGRGGRRAYRTEALRALALGELPGAAHAAGAGLDPVLCGAPFVDRDGRIVALCAGARGDGVVAIPIAPVRDALLLLERQAAR